MTAIAGASTRRQRLTGQIVTALPVLFLIFDITIKLMVIEPVRQSLQQLGYPVGLAIVIGVIELVCLVVYLVPGTSVLGAILLTGYLGGAVATHVRIGSPLFSHVLFPIYVGALIWGGLYLREKRLGDLVPVRRA
ncbi:MAG TPA: DoxX family protein [Gemmatimonadales bacterium]